MMDPNLADTAINILVKVRNMQVMFAILTESGLNLIRPFSETSRYTDELPKWAAGSLFHLSHCFVFVSPVVNLLTQKQRFSAASWYC